MAKTAESLRRLGLSNLKTTKNHYAVSRGLLPGRQLLRANAKRGRSVQELPNSEVFARLPSSEDQLYFLDVKMKMKTNSACPDFVIVKVELQPIQQSSSIARIYFIRSNKRRCPFSGIKLEDKECRRLQTGSCPKFLKERAAERAVGAAEEMKAENLIKGLKTPSVQSSPAI
ncbi:hypothetical protein FB45DRAFT_862804 [Roridomyces roridus]|uniref:Uncharacterized protein n=1 Tax=Roridomyces roridus TaxID=1738132 RepID=A0AAD7C8B2_9AGAR|nr:hypothetical protein FB45DRAFT_862792 [Roridomyces roridus]KAJ7641682.1 hypothetical protein FB45DRAFT_862804 [Roridomyces roridus]